MDAAAYRAVYEFGEFRLDASRRVLSVGRDGERVPLAPKVFDAALYLVQRAGELIPKERLLAELWPGVVVEENSLTQLISELRRALGETRGDNRYVATVPRRGYQFVAEVTRISLPPAVPLTPDPSIAVLPLGNPGHATVDDVLAAGIAESIRHRLAGMRELRLVAHDSSSLPLRRDQQGDARALGLRLGVRYLVLGTVQHLGSHVRITNQLIDCKDGSHLWSLRFDHTTEDLFALEDEIAQTVARAVCRSLLGTTDVDGADRAAVVRSDV